ncbi:CRISPR-associated protein Cas2 [Ferroacidibacillus organovorans]|uniref:CRISPR-associated endoribonuclease Cas2 n=2 Tax=Ferroacidibacillus organovorans TaxID=1765683 RepID=A0A853K9K9_9BACL|nr:CRISPR-associated endonuclease Cas2 [Ferroacidibacillus organovorans]KYP81797.1 CRISPR-associated endonuclease Cas2 [Ferroacidibacillus organovorans]OAG93742.1 CRISPR-associated protein Cas2 [Ferroacidibacillus organovorans]
MRLLVLFDLPVGTGLERKAASRFRTFLLTDGYYMIQFSCYCRICGSFEIADKHERRLEANLPVKGSVRSLVVTEKQFSRMKILVGEHVSNEVKIHSEQLVLF